MCCLVTGHADYCPYLRQSEGLRYEIAPYLKKSGWEEAEKIRNFALRKRFQEKN